jgi:hypothetical protein
VLIMSEWPQIDLDVMNDIHLDPKNVRLETTSAQVEADIIEDLFVNEDALGLVEGISQIGYLSHEVPIVVKRRGKYIVVEGNRRVAALKAIQNPMIIPEFQARVATLAQSIPNKANLAKIAVKVAPNQTQADQLIAALHTSNPRRPWTPARQAAFFQAQIDAGRTYKQLLSRYPTVDVRRFVFRGHMVNLFKTVPYSDPDLHDFLETKSWRRGLSALARVFESKDFQDITGINMDDHGRLLKSVSDEVFNEMATAIVRGMLDGNINTRSLNTTGSPRFIQLMAELRQLSGASADRGSSPSGRSSDSQDSNGASGSARKAEGAGKSSSGKSAQGQSPAGGSGTQQSAHRGVPPKTKQRFLEIGHLKVPGEYPVAVGVHLGELATIDIQRLPNATFLMLRAILEKSIKSFAEAQQEDIKASGNNERGFVQLGHALKWLLDYVKRTGPRSLIQPIQGVASGKLVNYTASKDALDAINHNHQFRVEPDEVIHMWNSIDPLMRYVMKP